jgi:hypothetical protein
MNQKSFLGLSKNVRNLGWFSFIGVQWAFSFGAGMALIAALLAIILMGEPIKNSNHLIPNSK